MDHIAAGERESGGNFGLSRFAAVQLAAGGKQLRSGGTVNGAIYAAAAQQRAVGGVDNGIHVGKSDIA